MRRAIAIAMVALTACIAEMDDPQYVHDLRVLAIRAEPAECLIPFDPQELEGAWGAGKPNVPPVQLDSVSLEALLVDSSRLTGNFNYRWRACPPTDDLRCEGMDPVVELATGTATATGGIRAVLEPDLDLLVAGAQTDPLFFYNGIPLMVELRVDNGEEEVWAAKRVRYIFARPEERQPNHNPSLDYVVIDDQPVEDEVMSVLAGTEVTVTASIAPSQQEEYLKPTTDGGVRSIVERIDYSLFATGGEVGWDQRYQESIARDFEAERVGEFPYILPQRAANLLLWIVVQDDRGGVDWREVRFHLQ